MEIFVRAYQDSNGDGIGDLQGLISRLDYLQSLGVRGLWLMPITASADHDHGYAGTDFRRVEPAYGSLADVDALIQAAHARGIGVIIDYMVNHSAADSPLFRASAADRDSPWRPWYVWQDSAPTGWEIWGINPWHPHASGSYFATFGADMPDFNLRHAPALDYHLDSLRFWLNRGLDGFRLDAVPHLVENSARDWNDQPESRALTRRMRALVTAYAGRHVVCEATADPKAYARDDLCGSAFAFGLESQLVPAARGEPEAVRRLAAYFDGAPGTLGVFVSNHDQFAGRRLWDQVGGDLALYKLTAATYLLLPGTPYIYYGEEIGQSGAKGLSGDPEIRAPMSWTADPAGAGFSTGRPFRPLARNAGQFNAAAQAADPESLLAHYTALLALRKRSPAIARGSWEHAVADGATLSVQRKLGAEHMLLTYNYGRAPASLALDGLPAGARLVATLPASRADAPVPRADAGGRLSLTLAAQSFAVWRVLSTTATPTSAP
jgi:glycosidase